MISKILLWIGFVLSLIILPFGILTGNGKPLVIAFWLVILFGSGYKLFFKK